MDVLYNTEDFSKVLCRRTGESETRAELKLPVFAKSTNNWCEILNRRSMSFLAVQIIFFCYG